MIVSLDDARAIDTALAGAKAANLALARRGGLPGLPGAVLTTDAAPVVPAGADRDRIVIPEATAAGLCTLYDDLSERGRYRLVARSSSTVEDLGASSMAGRFTSVLGIDSDHSLIDAVRDVLASSATAAAIDGVAPRPMAVLIQRQVVPAVGGILFGVDPVSGDRRHAIVEAAVAGPEVLVSGRERGVFARIGRFGRIVEGDPEAAALLSFGVRRRLAAVSRKAWHAFDGPQDIEWIVDQSGRFWVLQTRPVTAAVAVEHGRSHLLGQGPLAETFPMPLRRLEHDLWVEPIADAMREAMAILGVVSRRRLRTSPVATSVRGWPVCDLELIGVVDHRSPWRRLTPLAASRRLRAAWRVGQLRVELPTAAHELIARTEEVVTGVGRLGAMSDDELVELLRRTRGFLVSLHGQQMLAGVLLPDVEGAHLLAAVASAALRSGRANGHCDAQIIATDPVALGLVAPRIGGTALPRISGDDEVGVPTELTGDRELRVLGERLVLRDALRWWSRLVQELQARIASELGRRLHARGVLDDSEDVALLSRDELAAVLGGAPVPDELDLRRHDAATAPLPSAFRLDGNGAVVPDRHVGRTQLGGRGAGGGQATGIAVGRDGPVSPQSILVVPTLDPSLAPLLPRIGGLVAETGSVLSHLAILAREYHVPTVVAVEGACDRFPPGSALAIDGRTGEVRRYDSEVNS
ncbi:MAG: PEP/pyruvate-binding domain-containing protein [Acidimicrobiia bacterium]